MKLKRLNNIVEYVRAYDLCTYEDLCKQFDVSISTIRRDIDELEKLGKIEKVFGGIRLSEQSIKDANEATLFKYDYERDKIAKAASELVQDGDIIMLGSGSTVAHMVKYLKNKKGITLVTNNLAVLNETLKCDFNVISIGGNLDKKIMSFVGLNSSKQVSELNANKCFLSCNGVNLQSVSNVADLEADLKRTEIRISDKTILLADHSKFDKMSLYKFASMSEIDYIITNKKPDKEYEEVCKKNNCTLIVAK